MRDAPRSTSRIVSLSRLQLALLHTSAPHTARQSPNVPSLSRDRAVTQNRSLRQAKRRMSKRECASELYESLLAGQECIEEGDVDLSQSV